MHTSVQKVASALRKVALHDARARGTAALLNPIPYTALYAGHKVHIDQNEKLVMFGVTHVAAIDRYSRKSLVSFRCLLKILQPYKTIFSSNPASMYIYCISHCYHFRQTYASVVRHLGPSACRPWTRVLPLAARSREACPAQVQSIERALLPDAVDKSNQTLMKPSGDK